MRSTIAALAVGVILIVLPTVISADESPNVKFSGHYECHSTTFKWPSAPSEPLIQTATGTTEFISDGKGRFISGSGVINVLDDTARPPTGVTCHFTLREGRYSLGADGTGSADLIWTLAPGSALHCSGFVPGDTRPTGYIDETRDTNREGPSRSNFVIVGDRSYFSIVTPISSALGVCDKASD